MAEQKKAQRIKHGPRVRVQVEQGHIDTACRKDSGHCMVADAVEAAVPDATSIKVDLQTIRWSDKKKGRRFYYLTPRIAQMALLYFDMGVSPEPFAFQLRDAQSVALGATRVKEHARIVNPHGGTSTRSGVTPVKVGGKAPPVAALAHSNRGNARGFGMRGLDAVKMEDGTLTVQLGER